MEIWRSVSIKPLQLKHSSRAEVVATTLHLSRWLLAMAAGTMTVAILVCLSSQWSKSSLRMKTATGLAEMDLVEKVDPPMSLPAMTTTRATDKNFNWSVRETLKS